jgi:putative transcription antitermination factor YqgF
MRVLALDYGSARCGCALGDPTGTIVTPIDPVLRPATRRGLAELAALVAEREVERVVVGLPLSLSGGDSDQTRETRAFARRLARRLGEGVPVELHDERFTTRLARRDVDASACEDSRAAAHLLEGWLAGGQRRGEVAATGDAGASQRGGTGASQRGGTGASQRGGTGGGSLP